MWISKRKWNAFEKRLADLENKVQGQPREIAEIVAAQLRQQMTKAVLPHHREN